MKRNRLWAEVDLEALKHNFTQIKKLLTLGTKVMAIVKANAYGHGAVPVAKALVGYGVDMLGVGDSSEALELRRADITAPILILGALIEGEVPRVVHEGITPCIHSRDIARLLQDEAARQNVMLDVHINVDTGMSRLGISPRNAIEMLKEIAAMPNLKMRGLMTHFSSAGAVSRNVINHQLVNYHQVVAEALRNGIHFDTLHAANSTAALRMGTTHLNMVRLGIALYGIDPSGFFSDVTTLNPVLSFKTRIIYLKTVPPGTPIGYDRTFSTYRETRVATLPVGYNDGYPFLLSNKARVLVRGSRAPVIGGITMDYTMIDVTDIPATSVGDEITLIGKDGYSSVTAAELANLTGTIPYEITCQLGKRVRRIYFSGEQHEEETQPRQFAAIPD